MLLELERFAAYASARDALIAIQRATSAWPPEIAEHARATASNILLKTAEAIEHEPTSVARRTCLRDAIVEALMLASLCDMASSHGIASQELEESLRHTSRTISMLGMSYHATATVDD